MAIDFPKLPEFQQLRGKQKLFVAEYVRDFNASRAARDAGYSEGSCGSIGTENLQKPQIKAAIREYLDAILDECAENLETRIIRRLTQIAFDSPNSEEHNVLKAVEMLGKYKSIFTDKIQHSGSITINDDIS